MFKEHNKLVRDNIPTILKSKGISFCYEELYSPKQYEEELKKKLQEECQEYIESNDIMEIIDILEVIYAIAKVNNFSKNDLENMRKSKAERNGSFYNRIFLEYTQE